MLILKKLNHYAINLFYKTYPPFAYITYDAETLFYIWKENFKYFKLMLNATSFFQIRKFNKLRIKFLESYFPEYLLVSIRNTEDNNNYFSEHIDLKYFSLLREFILEYGFKTYYISDILNLNDTTLSSKIKKYFLIFDYIKNNHYFTENKNVGLNFCINFYDNINLEKNSIPENIMGFSLCQIYKFHYYNFYIGLNIDCKELSEDDIKEFAFIYLHEQAHSIDMALYCHLKKPLFLTNLFSNYKNNKDETYFYKIYQEIFNSSYNKTKKVILSDSFHIIEKEKIKTCDCYSEFLDLSIMNNKDKILFIDFLERSFFKKSNLNTFPHNIKKFLKQNNSSYQENNKIYYNKKFFCYLYKKENNFNLFYNNLNTSFIDSYFNLDISHQKYLLDTEEKFANTRFYNTGTSYTYFLFEELIKEIFITKNSFFYP